MSMTEFVLNIPSQGMEVQSIGIQGNNRYQKCIRYANFLSQKLELWMFVTCKLVEGVWVVLEEPKDWKNWQDVYIANNTEGKTKDRYTSQLSARRDCQEYQEAKDRVLFEGFKFKEAEHSTHRSFIKFPNKSRMLLYPDLWRLLTIEDLVKYNLELTPTAEKQIGI